MGGPDRLGERPGRLERVKDRGEVEKPGELLVGVIVAGPDRFEQLQVLPIAVYACGDVLQRPAAAFVERQLRGRRPAQRIAFRAVRLARLVAVVLAAALAARRPERV